MAGVLVTFIVTAGGGTITGSTVTTNASGVATVGGWTLGTVAGSNSLVASASGVPPITFIANGVICPVTRNAEPVATSVLLPSLGGALSSARAINEGGVVVGSSTDNQGLAYAVRWTPLGNDFWRITAIGGANSQALAINAKGDAVGYGEGGGKLWPAAGGEIDLGPNTIGRGINVAETIVGGLKLDSPLFERAVVWKKPADGWLAPPAVNQSEDLPLPANGTGSSLGTAINDLGAIGGAIGINPSSPSACVAVRWDASGDHWTQPIFYSGTAAFGCTIGYAINRANDIAGYLAKVRGSSSLFPMFLHSCGVVTNLQSVGSAAGQGYGVNNEQVVVGSQDAQNGTRAFVWSPGGTVRLLGAPVGVTAEAAFGINNQNPAQAVGYVRDSPNGLQAIVWTLR